MKRVQLIEWGIVTVGLIFGYKLVQEVFSILLAFLYDFSPYRSGELVKLVIYFIVYAALFILLIRKSSAIAQWVNGSSGNDSIPLKINIRSLLQVILTSICVATILSDGARMILYLFDTFKEEAGRNHEPVNHAAADYRFKMDAIETILAFVMMYFSGDISGWLSRKNEAEELILESEPEKEK